MIQRYTRKQMGDLWSPEKRFGYMLAVEKRVAEVQGEQGWIPMSSAKSIVEKSSFDLKRIQEIEETTKHDVIAFVSAVAETVGDDGKYVHFGLTSSDVLDTALALQVADSLRLILEDLKLLRNSLVDKISLHKDSLCAGRTHGMHAEPTTFGFKLAGFEQEFQRHQVRIERALNQILVGKLSGAVGTNSYISPEMESEVLNRLGLEREPVATQVIPRDRHAEVMTALALLGGGIERLSVELRHLQRTELGEVIEGFSSGQKGSSAMPHKKNPISAENLTGCARLLRSYAQAAMENMALWHERDISHSSVERVILPDAFILADYALDRLRRLVEELSVNEERMLEIAQSSQGNLFSSHLLLALVETGMSREDAYKEVQRISHSMTGDDDLKNAFRRDPNVGGLVPAETLDEIFSGERHLKNVKDRMKSMYGGRS